LLPSGFTRFQDNVIRYVGFGIGGARQSSSSANSPPYSNIYPLGYEYSPGAPHNTQSDINVNVSNLERPVSLVDYTAPAPPYPAAIWMKEIAPATFPTVSSVRYVAAFGPTDLVWGSFTSVPVAEIGLYTSGANPNLPNGAAGSYPGAGTFLACYDTFDPFHKTGVFSVEVRWELRL
jgi:hypothetical protein